MISKCYLTLFVLVAFGVAGYATSTEPKKYALVIGVEKYENAGFTNLNYAEDDAMKLAELLKKSGFQVLTLLGSSTGSDKATLQNIHKAIDEKFLPAIEKLSKQDIVVVYMAGHGLQTVVNAQEDAFFCPTGAIKAQPSSWLSLSDLTIKIGKRSLAQNNLLLIDACRNSVGRGGIDGKNVELIKDNMAIFFACSFGERSTEPEKLQHGLFTFHLLRGLEGEAKDSDGDVTWDTLVSHVKKRVSESDSNQHPNQVSNLQGRSPVLAKFPIGIPVRPPLLAEAPKSMAGVEIPIELATQANVRKYFKRDAIGLLNKNMEEIVYVSVSAKEVSRCGGDFDFTCDYRNDHATEFCLRSGASTRRFQVLADREIYIAGNAQRDYDTSKFFPDDKPWTLRLSRRNGLVRVHAISPIDGTDVPVQAFEFDGPIHEIRIGIKNAGLVFAAECMGTTPTTPLANANLFIERFATTAVGGLPTNWVASPPGGIGVTRQHGMPCLTRFTEQVTATLPNSVLPMLTGDYIVECDYFVAGGGSHSPSSNFDLIAVAGKERLWFPCNAWRGSVRIGNWQTSDSKTNAYSNYGSLFTRFTVRLEKQSGKMSLMMVPINGTAPVVFHSAAALDKRITAIHVGFSENKNDPARLYEVRIEKLK